MSDTAVVFPGQGSQRRGMALDFAEQHPESQAVLDEASSVLPFDVFAMFREEDPRLEQTEFAQPCILAAEIAILRGLQARFGFEPGWFGGHSLGEFTALVAAGVMRFATALRLVHARGKLMQSAAPLGFGAMAAIVRDDLPLEEIRELAGRHGVDLANDNSTAQVVVSGERVAVDALCSELASDHPEGDLRLVPLAVSAPFHSRYMVEVEAAFRRLLDAVRPELDASKATRVTSNFTGQFHTGLVDDLIESLTRQVSAPVRWRDNMAALAEVAGTIFEVGPNRPLSGFFRKAGMAVAAIIDVRSAARAFGVAPVTAEAQ